MSFRFVLIVFICIIAAPFCLLNAQQAPRVYVNSDYKNVPAEKYVLSGNEYRRIVDLNGEWQVRLGDKTEWHRIGVPGSVDYKGILHFRKVFRLPEDAGDYHIKLCALAVNYICSIKLNGVFIGAHSAGYTSFSFDIIRTSLRPGQDNVLEIDVDGRIAYDSPVLPRPVPWGWKSYSGIIREIYLLMLPKTAVTDLSTDYEFDRDLRNCDATLKIMIQNYSQAVEAKEGQQEPALRREDIQEVGYYIEVYNRKTDTLVKSTAANPKFLRIYRAVEDTMLLDFRAPALWRPSDPVMYEMVVTLIRRGNIIVDRVREKIGFRDVRMKPDGLYLNGEKITVKGIYRFEMHPDYGVSLPYYVQQDDLLRIKNLGINTVRSGPFPNHPYFYDLCDELGIMALEEIPVHQWPVSGINRPEFVDQAVLYVQEMVKRDRFHPSIIGWGIGSGLNVSHENTATYVETLAQMVRSIDKRPVYYGTGLLHNDICDRHVDFKLLDLYDPDLFRIRAAFDQSGNTVRNIPVFIGRVGSDVLPDNVDGYQNPMSLSHQAKYTQDLYVLLMSNDAIPGMIFWSYADWQGDVPVIASGTKYQGGMYYRGLVTDRRVERPAYLYLKAATTNSQIAPLVMGEPPMESQRSIIFTGFGIIVIFLVLSKQDRWFGKNFRRSMFSAKIFFEDLLDRRNIQLWHTTMLGIASCSSFAIGLAGFGFFYKRDVYIDLILSQFVANSFLKHTVVYLFWNPVINIIVTTIILFGIIVLISLLYGFVLSIMGFRGGFSYGFNVLIWPGSFYVFMIPVTMALYSVLEHESSLYFYVIVSILTLLTYTGRLILALRVSANHFFNRSIISLIAVLVIFLGGLAWYFESTYHTFTFIDHYITSLQSQIY